jgi:nitroreductase
MTDAYLNRRSIRKYKPDPVPEEMLEAIIKAGMYAPSAVNCRPWHFIVCTERRILNDIMKRHPYSAMLGQAPVCIAVCADLTLRAAPNYLEDCAAATQNILLCAHEMGLGTCWMGVTPRRERMEPLKKFFKLPEQAEVFSLITVGYPDEVKPRPSDRYQPERVHEETW